MIIIIFAIGFCVLIPQTLSGYNEDKVEELFKWKKVEFEHRSKSEYLWIGPYKCHSPENTAIIGMGYHSSGLMIVTFLRSRPGVPTTLGAFCVKDYHPDSSPRIWRFPNNEVNDLRATDFEYPTGVVDQSFGIFDVKRIISVFHVTIDERCNRAFFVDNGQVEYNRNVTHVVQKPALVVVDLPSNGCEVRNFPIIRRAELPDEITARGSNGFIHVILDYQPGISCDDLFLYITNTFNSYLVVYDYMNNDFWAFDHQTFQPVVSESYIVFDKTFSFQIKMGILSIALGQPDEYGDKLAYYTPLAGTAQYAVSTKVLKDKRNSPVYYHPDDFRIMGYRGCGHQSLKTVIDYNYGVMFYSEVQSNQIRCWNIKKPLNPDNIGVAFESEKLVFGAQLFLDPEGYLWFHSSQIPVIYNSDSPLDLNKVNARIFRMKVSDAIRGTVCEDPNTLKL